jgi:hypothetical protein
MIVQLSPERHSIILSPSTSEYSISLQRNCTTLERKNLGDNWPILSAPVLSRLTWIPSPAGILYIRYMAGYFSYSSTAEARSRPAVRYKPLLNDQV